MNKKVEEVIKEKLTEQYRRGFRDGAYGVAGAIHDIIRKHNGPNLEELIQEIESLLKPMLGIVGDHRDANNQFCEGQQRRQ